MIPKMIPGSFVLFRAFVHASLAGFPQLLTQAAVTAGSGGRESLAGPFRAEQANPTPYILSC
jgi:hypothetical protein